MQSRLLPTDHLLAVCGGASSAFFRAAEGDLHLLHLLLEYLLLLGQLLVTTERKREKQMVERRFTRVKLQRVGGLGAGEFGVVEALAYTLVWLRSSSFSSVSFWLLSSIPSTTSFSLRTSSCSFWLLIWRSATQYTNSDVSLGGEGDAGEHKNTRGRVLTVQFFRKRLKMACVCSTQNFSPPWGNSKLTTTDTSYYMLPFSHFVPT